jgi:hypothetical protein
VALLALGHAPAFGPFATHCAAVTRDASFHETRRQAPRGDENFFRLSYEFYRNVVSAIDGPVCPHRPTCSRYGFEAVQRHGLVGMWLTVDRLWRGAQSSAVRRLHLVEDAHGLRLDDPLEESTFWFSR